MVLLRCGFFIALLGIPFTSQDALADQERTPRSRVFAATEGHVAFAIAPRSEITFASSH